MDIRNKIAIGEILIEMLEQDPDPRAPEVREVLQAQVAELRATLEAEEEGAALEAEEEGASHPLDQVVGLKSLTLSAKIGR